MKIQTKDLDGIALKWAALTCDGWTDLRWKDWIGATSGGRLVMTSPSIERHADFDDLELDVLDIIERNLLKLMSYGEPKKDLIWVADLFRPREVTFTIGTPVRFCQMAGSTVEEAVLRCYVASKLGDEVEVPDTLFEGRS